MSEDFKKKLDDYANGTLSEKERKEVENELGKLEIYQAYVGEMMGKKEPDEKSNISEKKIVKRGKWKARFFNTFIIFGKDTCDFSHGLLTKKLEIAESINDVLQVKLRK